MPGSALAVGRRGHRLGAGAQALAGPEGQVLQRFGGAELREHRIVNRYGLVLAPERR